MGGEGWVDRGPQLACWGSEGFSHEGFEEGLSIFGLDSWMPLGLVLGSSQALTVSTLELRAGVCS